MSEEELAEFRRSMEDLRARFRVGFWQPIYPHIEALTRIVESFNGRLIALERKANE